MTRYAIDTDRQALLAIWATGRGDTASITATLPKEANLDDALAVAEQLTALSQTLWRCYTHPASAAASHEENSEGWRRDLERRAFDGVIDTLRRPALPDNGIIQQSYVEVTEAAQQVGRALHVMGGAEFSEAVITDVQAELAAIERAELGDLNGRARQAVALSRGDASPAQVAAADTMLEQNPFGDWRLFTELDSTATSVAAAHWLAAAADVVATATGIDQTRVVVEADNIEQLPVTTPTLVLERIADGETPYDVVVSLVRDAMAAAAGEIPDTANLLADVDAAYELLKSLGDWNREMLSEMLPQRTTPLDPARPAADLLEDLLEAIRGCWMLWLEQGYTDNEPMGVLDEGRVDDAEPDYHAERERITEDFLASVRAEAARSADRLA